MNSISSAIIAAAGVHCFAVGAQIAHDETQVFVMLVGFVIAAIGMFGWARSTFWGMEPPVI